MILYKLEKVVQEFGGRKIIDIDFLEIEKGGIYALLGSNGAGKTTLLNLLGFLDKPNQGQIEFMGESVSFSEKSLQRLRQQVVMVNQRPILFSTSVYKNMEFGLKIRKVKPKKRKLIIEEKLDLVGLSHLIQSPAHKLSGGETQRIVLARALALSPQVILCDEPTSSVDLESQNRIIELLKTINAKQGITIVLTSHNQTEVKSIANRSFFIDRGRITRGGYDNLLSGEIISDNNKHFCLISERIKLETEHLQLGHCRVTLDPEKISLLKPDQRTANTGVIGVLKKVDQLENNLVQLQVDVGVSLTIVAKEKDYLTIRPLVGEIVHLEIKPQGLYIL